MEQHHNDRWTETSSLPRIRLKVTPDKKRRSYLQRQAPPIYIWIVASVAAVSGFLFGFDTAVINGALVFLRQQFGLSNVQTELAASSLLLGCLIGAGSAGVLSDRFGRRDSLRGAALLFTLSAIGSAGSVSFITFSAARLFGGLAIGLASALTPIYISEVAPPESRGRLVSLNQLAIVIGILSAYLTNWQLSSLGQQSWRWMFGVAVVPSTIFLVGLFFIPESPRWLITKGRLEQGRQVLARVVGDENAARETLAIELALSDESPDPGELFSPVIRTRLFIAIVLAVLQQICGINTVLYYGSVLMTEHMHGKSAKYAIGVNVVVGLVNLICTVIAMAFIDRWGRRTLLLIASGGMTIALSCLALSLRSSDSNPILIFSSVLLYVAFFAVGLGPVLWVYISEIFPTRIRGQATSAAVAALWIACLVVTLTFLSIVDSLGISSAFLLYAAFSLITFFFVWKWVPETRGRSLEEIQEMWRSDKWRDEKN
jgi:SP family arabinose:H+ symporter-like MFS transporter